jgi:hypothetical protein
MSGDKIESIAVEGHGNSGSWGQVAADTWSGPQTAANQAGEGTAQPGTNQPRDMGPSAADSHPESGASGSHQESSDSTDRQSGGGTKDSGIKQTDRLKDSHNPPLVEPDRGAIQKQLPPRELEVTPLPELQAISNRGNQYESLPRQK